MFEIRNVTKKYEKETALNDISLNIEKGLNFIVGASGSGKTTLLKIISGIEKEYEGEVSYFGKDIKKLTADEQSYFYNNVFGFIWQDFNLLENNTVAENIKLPEFIKGKPNDKALESILKDLKIEDIVNQKVKYLSGGQKQRVAIARELMKNPKVIFADEPTSALDEKTAKSIIGILRKFSKNKIVIVVTHDTSLIKSSDNVFELDKGELVTKCDKKSHKFKEFKMNEPHKLSFKNMWYLTLNFIKRKFGKYILGTLSLLIVSVLLMTTLSGVIDSKAAFRQLYKTYGNAILDIDIAHSFQNASGGDPNIDMPDYDVTQDITGLYEKYENDKRIESLFFSVAFQNIKVEVDGHTYSIETSNNVPIMNEMLSGNSPKGNAREVVVPEYLIHQMGISKNKIIGKTINFHGSMFNWDSGRPIEKNVSTTAIIVGVANNTVKYDYNGTIKSYDVNDSFFFSKLCLDEMRKQANITNKNINFIMRTKSPEDLINIKDELNGIGIVPLGRFSLVEDFVRIKGQTGAQSKVSNIVISIVSVVLILAVYILMGFLRRKEYAIFKISGYNKGHMAFINLGEIATEFLTSLILFLITSPLWNLMTVNLFGLDILNAKMIFSCILIMFILAIVSYGLSYLIISKTKISKDLKTGVH